jgi:subtilisin family serine protease
MWIDLWVFDMEPQDEPPAKGNMDVSKKQLIGALMSISLVGCGSKKSSDTVFDDFSSQSSCSGQKVEGQFIVHWEDGKFTVENAANAEDFKKNFIEPQLSQIKTVNYDRVIQIQDLQNQDILSSDVPPVSAGHETWGQKMIQTESVWRAGFQGQGVAVGIVDSVVDISHQKLRQQVLINTSEIPNNGIDDDKNGYIDDVYGKDFTNDPQALRNEHGTHVAGIVAASSGGTMSGVAPKAKIIPAAFIGSGSTGNLSSAILAMQYAVSRGAKIINASWGGAPCVSTLRDAFSLISSRGVLLVVAAGNDYTDLDQRPNYPAAFNFLNQLTVGAASHGDVMTSFSNSSLKLVHLAAPGENILSTTPYDGFEEMTGTSMATPFVSGAAALLWSARPQAQAFQIKQALLESVDVVPGREYRVLSRGRLNVKKAYERLIQLVP